MHNYVWHYWHWHTGYILHTLAYTLHTCLLVLDKTGKITYVQQNAF